jgi:hypothetical protein
MLSALFQRIAAKRLEKRFHAHFESASGPVSHRNAVAVAMMELEDPWVSQVMAVYSAVEQPVFLMAYECFILWVLIRALQQRLQPADIQDLTKRVRDAFVTFGCHDSVVFEKIWPYTAEFMPIALKGGAQTGAVYPLPLIIQAATSAGYPLPQKILDYRLGVHILVVMKRISETLSSDANPDA